MFNGTKRRKIEHGVSLLASNGTFEVPAESTSKDARQELQREDTLNESVLVTKQKVAPKKCRKKHRKPLKVLQMTGLEEALLDVLKISIPSVSHEIPNEVLKENLVDMSKATKGAEKVQVPPLKELCEEIHNDAFDSILTQEVNETLTQRNDWPEAQQNKSSSKLTKQPKKNQVQTQVSDETNDVLNASGMQVPNDSLRDSYDKERNELFLATKESERVQGDECCEIPNVKLTKAPPSQVSMEMPEGEQNELVNRMPSKVAGHVKKHSLLKKSSRPKILVQALSTKAAQVLKTSTKKTPTRTSKRLGSVEIQSLEKELPRSSNSNREVPTVAAKVLKTSTIETSLKEICIRSEYISEEEDERDLLGYDGCQPKYA